MADTKETSMRAVACDFIHSFGGKEPQELLETYFTSEPEIHEHGPDWASSKLPFLGKPFKGTEACLSYFSLLGGTLKMLPGADLPQKSDFVVDVGADSVSFKLANVSWEAVGTGKRWTEVNMHRLSGFDSSGRRFTKWEVFADPLSAWMAIH